MKINFQLTKKILNLKKIVKFIHLNDKFDLNLHLVDIFYSWLENETDESIIFLLKKVYKRKNN